MFYYLFQDGWSPLHHAANNGHLSIVTILLEKGSDPALKTKVDFLLNKIDNDSSKLYTKFICMDLVD